MSKQTKELLDERNKTHGSFAVGSKISQGLKHVIRDTDGYSSMKDIQKEALDNIFGKIGRIIAGDPDFIDTWRDVAGYSELIVKELEKTPGSTDVKTERIIIG